ncbi:amidoligase family protein [Rhodohalobacter halophilus]|uniref:amidoligase family protein n=1 Tax=Rhodohalobacter halophilus TaxID=1812810 RepID=UPI00083F8B64|nr:amidoligase family protein [Rhodohalobacter halophilus]
MNSKKFHTPPNRFNPNGDERKTGFEFEFTGISMEIAAEIVKKLYNGEFQKISTYKFEIQNSNLGTFVLELDAQLLREKKYEKLLRKIGINLDQFKKKESIEDSLKEAAASVVPFEIITPPIPLSKMSELNRLVNELRKNHVKGTGSSFLYAFGLHINPEAPNLSAGSILKFMRAYVLLDGWIRKDAKINISRRLTPFINAYEEEYIQHILQPDYRPDLELLIRDYFKYDNSRNRPLDLLPLFMHLNEGLTNSLIEEELTSSRPTYHYRLPNCSLEDENWALADEWNRWVLVEELAHDETSLDQYSRAWLRMKRNTLIGFDQKWIKLMDRWVNNVR